MFKLKVAIYSRKSIETDKGESIKNQIEMCKEYFKLRGSCTFEVFEDEGFSGGNINRPGFQLMMNRINEFDIIGCYKIDRIARNIVDFVNIYSDLEKHNVKLVSITESFDTSTPIGKMLLMIIASFAEMERLNIAQRVKDNMRELAKKGKWTGGVVPFGYASERVEDGSKKATYLKINHDEAEIVRKVFDMYLKVKSMHKIGKWVYETFKIKWCLSTIKNILTSPVYVKADNEVVQFLSTFGEVYGIPNNHNGIITYNRRPYSNGKHRWNDKSMFYAVSKHEGIIDPVTWLKVQTIQDENKTSPRPKNSQVSYLTSVLRCSKCGSPMTVSYNHKNKDGSISYVYLCTGRKSYGRDFCDSSQIKQIVFDEKFKEQLSVYDSLTLSQFANSVGHNETENFEKDIVSIEKKISTNNVKINNLVDKVSLMSNEAGRPFMVRIEQLTNENEELKIKLLYLKQKQLNSDTVTIEYLYERIKSFLKIFDSLNLDDKRLFIESFISAVKFDSDTMNAEIEFI